MSHARGPHGDIQEFDDFTSDISLITTDYGEGARNIFIVDDGAAGAGGAISVVTSKGTTRVLTLVKSGEYVFKDTWFVKINAAGTTVDKVIVGW